LFSLLSSLITVPVIRWARNQWISVPLKLLLTFIDKAEGAVFDRFNGIVNLTQDETKLATQAR
jgi:DMSO/TMAO reductase YedYZ molybdopterin-dependent catalytic subunit